MKTIFILCILFFYNDNAEAKPETTKRAGPAVSVNKVVHEHEPQLSKHVSNLPSGNGNAVDKRGTTPHTPPPPTSKPPTPAYHPMSSPPTPSNERNHQQHPNIPSSKVAPLKPLNANPQYLQKNGAPKNLVQNSTANSQIPKNSSPKARQSNSPGPINLANSKISASQHAPNSIQNLANPDVVPAKSTTGATQEPKGAAGAKESLPKKAQLSKGPLASNGKSSSLKRSVDPKKGPKTVHTGTPGVKRSVSPQNSPPKKDQASAKTLVSPMISSHKSDQENRSAGGTDSKGSKNASMNTVQALEQGHYSSPTATSKPMLPPYDNSVNLGNPNTTPKNAPSNTGNAKNPKSDQIGGKNQQYPTRPLDPVSKAEALNAAKVAGGNTVPPKKIVINIDDLQNSAKSDRINVNGSKIQPSGPKVTGPKNEQLKNNSPQNILTPKISAAKAEPSKSGPIKRSSNDQHFASPNTGKPIAGSAGSAKNTVPKSTVPRTAAPKKPGPNSASIPATLSAKTTVQKPVQSKTQLQRVKKSSSSQNHKGCAHKREAGGRVFSPKVQGQSRVAKVSGAPGERVKKSVLLPDGGLLYALNHPFDDPSHRAAHRVPRSVSMVAPKIEAHSRFPRHSIHAASTPLRHKHERSGMEVDFHGVRVKKSVNAAPENLLYSLRNSIIDASSLSTLHRSRRFGEDQGDEPRAALHRRKQRAILTDKPATKGQIQRGRNAIPEDLFYSLKKPVVYAPSAKSALHARTARKRRGMLTDKAKMPLGNPELGFFREIHQNSPRDSLNDHFWVRKI